METETNKNPIEFEIKNDTLYDAAPVMGHATVYMNVKHEHAAMVDLLYKVDETNWTFSYEKGVGLTKSEKSALEKWFIENHKNITGPSTTTKCTGVIMKPGTAYALPIKHGYLDIRVSTDSDYPGIDIEYVSNHEEDLPDDTLCTRPRVLLEVNEGILRAIIWGDPHSEDWSDCVAFECLED